MIKELLSALQTWWIVWNEREHERIVEQNPWLKEQYRQLNKLKEDHPHLYRQVPKSRDSKPPVDRRKGR